MFEPNQIFSVCAIILTALTFGFGGGWVITAVSGASRPDSVEVMEAAHQLQNTSLRLVYLGEDPEISALAISGHAVILQNVSTVKELDARAPLDGLIFDASFYDQLDKAWVQMRYAGGLAGRLWCKR